MQNFPSMIGLRFGRLAVLSQAESTSSGQRRWLCQCDCGNQCIVSTYNLTHERTKSCGCIKRRDLTGLRIGLLTVLERSDQFGPRGKRKVPLWKCQCDCGNITYKATDTLTNSDLNMCKECAANYATAAARRNAGYADGTQLSKIAFSSNESTNASGVRGVYLCKKTGKYRARITFRGKLINLGSFDTLEAAIAARKEGEEKYFRPVLASKKSPLHCLNTTSAVKTAIPNRLDDQSDQS